MGTPWYHCAAAPMVGQSDVPFRLTALQYGATSTWTCVCADRQMYHTDDILGDSEKRQVLLKALELGRTAPEARTPAHTHAPQIVQLAGDNPDALVAAARSIPLADGFDINFGCPQKRAQEGHYGGYLLARREWPLAEQLVGSLSQSVAVPVCAKIRLCSEARDTAELVVRLAQAGADIVTIHARHVAPSRRRAGPAKLEFVQQAAHALKTAGLHASSGGRTRILTNGNVRTHDDVVHNLAFTHADGAMVGEPLLGRPDIFLGEGVDAFAPLSTYLDMCARYGVDSPRECIQQHVNHMIAARFAPGRETRALSDALAAATTIADMQQLCGRAMLGKQTK